MSEQVQGGGLAADQRPVLPADTGLMEFVAAMLYRLDCERDKVPTLRWLMLPVELRRKYMGQALRTYLTWVKDEQTARITRTN